MEGDSLQEEVGVGKARGENLEEGVVEAGVAMVAMVEGEEEEVEVEDGVGLLHPRDKYSLQVVRQARLLEMARKRV